MQTVYGGLLTDVGSYIGKGARGILDIAGQAINIVATRGGADSTDLVTSAPTPKVDYTGPALIAGAAVVGFLVLAKTKKKRRR